MIRHTLVITVVNTSDRLAVNADGSAGMLQSACKAVPLLIRKAFTACLVIAAGMLSAHHNIALTAAITFVVSTVFYRTIQLSHL
jgi:hypothetical protein